MFASGAAQIGPPAAWWAGLAAWGALVVVWLGLLLLSWAAHLMDRSPTWRAVWCQLRHRHRKISSVPRDRARLNTYECESCGDRWTRIA